MRVDSYSCINCGRCAESCPAEALYQGDNGYEIDSSKCLECGCCLDLCPTNCIYQ